jgi:inosine/xanthosine triphosphate pyrophosphatase family protein
MAAEEKHRLSHRGRALRALAERLAVEAAGDAVV